VPEGCAWPPVLLLPPLLMTLLLMTPLLPSSCCSAAKQLLLPLPPAHAHTVPFPAALLPCCLAVLLPYYPLNSCPAGSVFYPGKAVGTGSCVPAMNVKACKSTPAPPPKRPSVGGGAKQTVTAEQDGTAIATCPDSAVVDDIFDPFWGVEGSCNSSYVSLPACLPACLPPASQPACLPACLHMPVPLSTVAAGPAELTCLPCALPCPAPRLALMQIYA